MTEEEIKEADNIYKNVLDEYLKEQAVVKAVTDKLRGDNNFGYYHYRTRRYGFTEEQKRKIKSMGNYAIFIPVPKKKYD